MIKVWILGCLLASAALPAIAADTRFSQAVPPEERNAMGIDRLNSDQVAILDALVRRDVALQSMESESGKTFSARLTADERKNTGLAAMSDAERGKLDAAVARHQAAAPRASLLTHPIFLPRTSVSVRPIEKKKAEAEIHGSIGLSYGWGDGYSTRGGSMIVNMTDPSKRYSVTIGYSETHVKGDPGTAILLDGPPYYNDRNWIRP